MVYDYIVTLKTTGRRQIDIFSLLLLSISSLVFIRQAYSSETGKAYFLYADAAIIVAAISINIYRQRKSGVTVFYRRVLVMAAIGWLMMNFLNWLMIPFIVLAIVEGSAKKPLELGFAATGVVINSFIRKKYDWSAFTNIILKDDLLTLDFKDNRLLQRETEDEEGDADADEFNEYCHAQITAAANQRS